MSPKPSFAYRKLLFAGAAIGTVTAAFAAALPSGVNEKAVIDDIAKRRIDVGPGAAGYQAPLGPSADQLLAGKRVVYLGEGDHFVHEKWDYRIGMTRDLVKRGFVELGFEMGRSDGAKLNRYVQTGDTRWLDQMCLYNSSVCERAERPFERRPSTPTWSGFICEERRFARSLRELREAGYPITVFGFDKDAFPGGAYQDIDQLLTPFKGEAVTTFRERLKRVPNETLEAEIERLTGVAKLLEDAAFAAKLPSGLDRAELLDSVLTLRGAFEFDRDTVEYKDVIRAEGAFERREREIMWREMSRRLKETPTDRRFILYGHNLHLAKDSDSLQFAPIEVKQRYPVWRVIGDYVADSLPGQVYSIWFTYQGGQRMEERSRTPVGVKAPGNRLEAALAKVGERYVVTLPAGSIAAKQLSSVPVNFNVNGGTASGLIGRQVDALAFVREVSAPRCE